MQSVGSPDKLKIPDKSSTAVGLEESAVDESSNGGEIPVDSVERKKVQAS